MRKNRFPAYFEQASERSAPVSRRRKFAGKIVLVHVHPHVILDRADARSSVRTCKSPDSDRPGGRES